MTSQPEEIDPAVVELAERSLAAAKAGKIKGAIVATVLDSGEVRYHMAGILADAPAVALTIAQRLKAKIERMIYTG